MAENPDDTFSYEELQGYLFGLAMIPEPLIPSEWMPLIFGGDLPVFSSIEMTRKMTGHLLQAHNSYIANFHNKTLTFPFTIETLQEDQFAALYEWVSGFEEALALHEELWDPEEYPDVSEEKKEQLYHSMMTIQGLVDPVEAMDYFADMPEEVFRDAFAAMEMEPGDREAQIQIFLLASLPLAIETFQEHARAVAKKRGRQLGRSDGPIPISSMKVGSNDSCNCASDKKFKKCCGDNDVQPKSNVIQVDFSRHGKKKANPATPAPIYQLKVELQGSEPLIWRRIQVPGNITLDMLHSVLQLCMDWEDQHLHQFLIDKSCYSIPENDDLWQTSRPQDERRFTLHQLADKIRPRFQYIYDFGDDWIHQISVEEVLPAQKDSTAAVLLAGERACPPEDIGGIHRYNHLVEILNDPEHEEYGEIADLLELELFEPEQFDEDDIAEINAFLQELSTL